MRYGRTAPYKAELIFTNASGLTQTINLHSRHSKRSVERTAKRLFEQYPDMVVRCTNTETHASTIIQPNDAQASA